MTKFRRAAVLFATGACLLLLHMVLLGSAAPRVRTLAVTLPGYPAGAPPIRIALLSDLHVSNRGDTPARIARTAALVDALSPDLVAIAGDFKANGMVGAHGYDARLTARPLAALHAPLGVWAVLGNHDTAYPERLRAALGALGIHVLRNEAVRLGPLALLGVGDFASHQTDVPATLRSWHAVGGVPVVLTHSPDSIPLLPPEIMLALAGHTHCGQVRFPLIGAPETQSRYGQRYGCGVVREGARTSVITAGLGMSSLPIRLGAAPDLWLVTVGR